MGIEIERKFLLRDESWRSLADQGRAIRQFYVAFGDGVSVRLRSVDAQLAWLTIKTGSGLARGEFEYAVPIADAEVLEASRQGHVIAKRRHRVPHGDLVIEIDVFEGALAPLVLAEIELPDAAHAFAPPTFLGREVTGEDAYNNSRLARDGLPNDFRA